MAQQLAMRDEDEQREIIPASEMTPMQLIAQVVENPNFDVDKLDKLMALQERWEDRQAERQFNAALAEFQAECPRIVKTREAAHKIKYAPLDKIMETIQPALSKHDLSVRFSTSWEQQGYITVTCTVSHKAGHSKDSPITIPVDDKMVANSSQKMGSANTYAKRYALSNALNLAFIESDSDATDLSEKITTDQVTEINDLIKDANFTEARKKKFLNWAGKSKSVEEIPASFYKDAVKHLKELSSATA